MSCFSASYIATTKRMPAMSELIDSAMALPTERSAPKTATDDDDAAPKPLNAMSLTACFVSSSRPA